MAADFWPQKPEGSRNLLSLYLADGMGSLDRTGFARLIAQVLEVKSTTTKAMTLRRMAAANVFSSYVLAPFYAAKNHWEIVQGWTITAARIAWAADKAHLGVKAWNPTFRLAVDAGKEALDQLCEETLTPDALYPHGFELDELTRSRCTICSGALATKVLIAKRDNAPWKHESKCRDLIEDLFARSRLFLWGESAVPFFLAQLWARDKLRGDQSADTVLFAVLAGVATVNSRLRGPKLPSPYESADDANAKALRRLFEGEHAMELQSSASYTLESLVTLMARRLWRNTLAPFWSRITKIDLIRLVPDRPRDLLLWSWGHERGRNQSRRFPSPQSWADLLCNARMDESKVLPAVLRENFDFAMLFVLCFPHRLTRAFVKHIDDTVRAL
jgi:hypothetical protein